MAQSKVEICNVALGMLGAGSIRDFTEDNKRARMCNAFYLPICDALVARFDWPFARRIAKLQQIVTTEPVPTGWYPYQLPTDCLTPRDLFPEGSQDKWVIMGRLLLCQKSEDVYLRYTSRVNESGTFPEPFAGLLAQALAVQLCMPITQDKELYKALGQQYTWSLNEAMENEANIGCEYREADNDPNVELFVTAGGNGGRAWESID